MESNALQGQALEGPRGINSHLFLRRRQLVRSGGPKWIIRYLYYAFIFSIPFEAVNIGVEDGLFALSRVIGYVFLLATPLQPSVCFRPPGGAFVCFLTYLYVVAVLGIMQKPAFTPAINTQLFTLLQMLILFWISYNLLRYEKVVKGTLIMLATSCIALAVLQVLGITSEDAADRMSAFGENPNALASALSLGLLALVGLAYGRRKTDLKARFLAWLCFGVLVTVIVKTGSRGGIAALVAGFAPFVLNGRSIKSMFKSLVIVVLALGFVIIVSYRSEVMRARWESTFLQGDTAGREEIFSESLALFLERPVLGWGPVSHYFELGSRLNLPTRDPHNSYLWVLEETGLLGAIPFFCGLWLCWYAAWKARKGIQGALPMAMVLCLLVINTKGTYLDSKLFWFVLAYALASSRYVVPPREWRQRA
jgi:O-antigen ligase